MPVRKTKTLICSFYMLGLGMCKKGDRCSFAHGTQELGGFVEEVVAGDAGDDKGSDKDDDKGSGDDDDEPSDDLDIIPLIMYHPIYVHTYDTTHTQYNTATRFCTGNRGGNGSSTYRVD